MKTLIFCFMLLPILMIGAEKKKSNVVGAWELLSITRVQDGESKVNNIAANDNASHLKIFTENHVVFVGERPNGDPVYGRSTYILEGDKYSENIRYHFVKQIENTVWKAKMEVQKDSLFLYWSPGGKGNLDKSNYVKETFVKVD